MRTYVSHLKISKTPIGGKNEFSKNISKDYIKMGKKFIQFFQDKSWVAITWAKKSNTFLGRWIDKMIFGRKN